MNERPANGSGNADTSAFDLEVATRRLMSALDALEHAVERRRDSDRDENELASRIQALGEYLRWKTKLPSRHRDTRSARSSTDR